MAASAEQLEFGGSPAELVKSKPLHSRLWAFAKRRPMGAVSGVMCVLILITAIGAWTGAFVPYDPIELNARDRLAPIWSESNDGSKFFILGTDDIGRDMFSRIIEGAKISVFFGIGVAAIAVVIGGIVGLISSYVGGIVDLIVQRVVDALQTVPLLVLAIAVVSISGPGIMKGFWILAFLSIPRPARVIRGSVLAVREEMYVDAARSLGATDVRIMLRHVLPNVMAPMIVLASYILAVAIIVEASLSFLGIGAQPPTPSWGAMLSGNGAVFFSTNPRLALMPGLAISIVVFATNMFGDSLRDELDPRLRGSN